jgi:hypothetical protein
MTQLQTRPFMPPSRIERASDQRLSLIRAMTGVAFSSPDKSATDYVKGAWPDDSLAALVAKSLDKTEFQVRTPDGQVVTKAAVTPPTTNDLPAIVATNVLPIIAPKSATVRLFAKCRRDSLDGISKIFFPYIAPGAPRVYVVEGGPMPLVRRSTTGTTLGPTRKILVGAAVSIELEEQSEAASETIGIAIEADITRSLDSLTFDAGADDGVRPAGLLHGLTAQPASNGTGLAAISEDIGSLAGAIADAGIGSDDMVIVCNDRQAAQLRTLVGPKFNYEILGSPQIPDKRLIGIAPSAVVSAYSGTPQLERATNALVHLDDFSPANIGIEGTPPVVAAPAMSASQCGLIVVRLRCNSAFARIAPGISFIDNVTW